MQQRAKYGKKVYWVAMALLCTLGGVCFLLDATIGLSPITETVLSHTATMALGTIIGVFVMLLGTTQKINEKPYD
ncbi:MAG: hypothetical protein ACP5FL_09410 [Thermoplasmatota archaeon]